MHGQGDRADPQERLGRYVRSQISDKLDLTICHPVRRIMCVDHGCIFVYSGTRVLGKLRTSHQIWQCLCLNDQGLLFTRLECDVDT